MKTPLDAKMERLTDMEITDSEMVLIYDKAIAWLEKGFNPLKGESPQTSCTLLQLVGLTPAQSKNPKTQLRSRHAATQNE